MNSKKLIYLIILILGLANSGRAELVAHWGFNEGSGTVAGDSSGNNRPATLYNGPQWVAGIDGGALLFDGFDDYVEADSYQGILGAAPWTVAVWIKTSNSAEQNILYWGTQSGGARAELRIQSNRLRLSHGNGNAQGDTEVTDGEWRHVAVSSTATGLFDDVRFYLDGTDDTRPRSDPDPLNIVAEWGVTVGRRPSDDSRHFDGLIDDVRMYDTVLTPEEIQQVATIVRAYEPKPASSAQNVGQLDNMGLISWNGGATAVWHNVYYGTSSPPPFVARVPMASTFYMAPREPDTTYCWRVDEEEADGTIYVGFEWDFTTSKETTHSPAPADGLHYIDPNIILSWGPAFSAATYDVYFGSDEAAVTEADPNSDEFKGNQVTLSFTPGALALGTTYYWRVDAESEKGAVWSFTTRPAIAVTDPNLVGLWTLDEGEGSNVLDWSGHGNHGIVQGEPDWVSGWIGDGAMNFSRGQYVAIDKLFYDSNNLTEVTVCAWIRTSTSGAQPIAAFDRNEYWRLEVNGFGGGAGQIGWSVMADTGQIDMGSISRIDNGQWRHVAAMFDNGSLRVYIDGRLDNSVSGGSTFGTGTVRYGFIAANSEAGSFNGEVGGNPFDGDIDDVRIYDRALTQAEIQEVMRGDLKLAWNPHPPNYSVAQIDQILPLTWSAGEAATGHQIYFGADETTVRFADTSTTGIYRGQQPVANTSYTPGETLVWGNTYYWRIDEVKSDTSVSKGRVWRFTVADFILVDDFEDYNDYTPDRIFEIWKDGFGYGMETAPPYYPGNGTGSAVGYLVPPFAEQTVVHGGDQSMPYFYDNGIPGWLQYSEAAMTLTRSRDWTAYGVKSLSLWFRGHPASTGSFSYDQGSDTYTVVGAGADIWDVAGPDGTFHDEFHFAYRTLTGVGSIIAQVLSVENTNGWAKAGVMIRDTLDANSVHAMVVVTPSNGVSFQYRMDAGGASASLTQADITAPQWVKLERDAGGNMSASYSDDGSTWTLLNTVNIAMSTPTYVGLAVTSHNAGVPCEATFSGLQTTGSVGAVWADQDIGIQNNDPEPLYVAISNSNGTTAVVTNPDPNAALIDTWTEWNIDLQQFSGQGVNLTDVNKVAIGFGNPINPQTGGSGLVYFDDIRLYQPRCIPSLAKPANSFNNDCVVNLLDVEILTDDWLTSGYEFTVAAPPASDPNLELYYAFEGSLADGSGNGRTGEPNGTIAYAAGKSGQAISFDGTNFVNVPDYNGVSGTQSRTCSAWIKTTEPGEIVTWGNNTTGQKWIWRLQNATGGAEVTGAVRIEVSNGQIVGSTDLRDDAWHHVAAVLDSDGTPEVADLRLYVDGFLDGSSWVTNQVINTADLSTMRIGRGPWNDRPFYGAIDELRVYSRALSHGEVASLAGYTAGTVLSQPVSALLSTLSDTDLNDDDVIDFKDFALLANTWLDEVLWP